LVPRKPPAPSIPTESPLIGKLRLFLDLTEAEIGALRAVGEPVRAAAARSNLITQGQNRISAVLTHSGWAIRHRTLPDGRRQILDFILPGDLCDPSVFVTPKASFSLTTITACTYAQIGAAALLDLLSRSPRLGAMLWWIESQEQSLLRDHLVAIGRLNAEERLAHLLWEIWWRLRRVNLAGDDGFEWPATQEMIADATGLSVVHVNRTLRRLERSGIIQRLDHAYQIRSPRRLEALAQLASGHEAMPLQPDIEARLRRN
jgi:CRP-like cAMP-binding protein